MSSITKYYQSESGKLVRVKQKNNKLSPAEEGRLKAVLGESFSTVDDSKNQETSLKKPKMFTNTGKFRGADYKTGVDNNQFRAAFSRLDTNEERFDWLNENVGKDGWIIDRQGTYLLTPKGQNKVREEYGMGLPTPPVLSAMGFDPKIKAGLGKPKLANKSGENLLAIDADATWYNPRTWEGEDFVDFLGAYGIPTALALATGIKGVPKFAPKVFPRLAKDPTSFKYLFGKNLAEGVAFGIGVGVDEALQKAQGISRQSWGETASEGFKEGLFWAVPGFALESAMKGIGIFVGGMRNPATYGEGTTGEKLLLKEIQDAADLNIRNTNVLSGTAEVAAKFLGNVTGARQKYQQANISEIYEKTLKELGIPLTSNLKQNTIKDFQNMAKSFLEKKKGHFDIVGTKAEKAMQETVQKNMSEIYKGLGNGKYTYDDVANSVAANQGKFYKEYGLALESLENDFRETAKKMSQLGDNKYVHVMNFNKLKGAKASPEDLAIEKSLVDYFGSSAGSGTKNMYDDSFLVLTPKAGIGTTKKDLVDVTMPDPRSTFTKDELKQLEELTTPRSAARFEKTLLEKNKDKIAALEPTATLNKELMEGAVALRFGVDSQGKVNVKTMSTENIQRILKESEIKPGTAGLESNALVRSIVDSDEPVFLSPTEYGRLLSGIQQFNFTANAGSAQLKGLSSKILEAAFKDIDGSVITAIVNKLNVDDMFKSLPKTAKGIKPINAIMKDYQNNLEHMLRQRQYFKQFKEVNDQLDSMKIFDEISSGRISANEIFNKFDEIQNVGPTFLTDVIESLRLTPEKSQLFKGGKIPKEFKEPTDLLDARAKELIQTIEKQKAAKGEKPFEKPTLDRLARQIALTELLPTMVKAEKNATKAKNMLGQLWFERLGLTDEGISFEKFAQDLSESLVPKPVAEKVINQFGKKNISTAEVLLSGDKRLLQRAKELNTNLKKLPKDFLAKDPKIVNELNNLKNVKGERGLEEAVNAFNKTLEEAAEFQSKKLYTEIMENGGLQGGPGEMAAYLSFLSKNDIKTLKEINPKQFDELRELAFISLFRETADQSADSITHLLDPSKVIQGLNKIPEETFNELAKNNLWKKNTGPYRDIYNTFETLSKYTNDAASNIGGIAKIGVAMRRIGALLPLSALGIGAALGGAGSGIFKVGLTLAGGRVIYWMASSPGLAKFLSKEIKPIDPAKSSIKDFLIDRTWAERILLAPGGGLQPAGWALLNNNSEANEAIARARQLYGDEVDLFGGASALPSIQAAQQRQQEVGASMPDIKSPFTIPSLARAAVRQSEAFGRNFDRGMLLPEVNPVEVPENFDIFTREALSGNNPATQQIAQRTRK